MKIKLCKVIRELIEFVMVYFLYNDWVFYVYDLKFVII